jgi:hypothetical protein
MVFGWSSREAQAFGAIGTMSPGEAMSARRSFGMIRSCREIRGSQAEGEITGNQEIIEVVEELKGEQWESFRERHRDWGPDLVLTLARQNCGMKLRELGKMAAALIMYRSASRCDACSRD